MTTFRSTSRLRVGGALLCLVIAGCSPAASVSPSPVTTASPPAASTPPSVDPSAVPSADASAGPSVAPSAVGGRSFTYAQTSGGVSNVTTLAAIDALRDDGYEVEVVELASPDLVIQGVSTGDFLFGRGGTAEVAIQEGSDIRIVVGVAANEWTVYADQAIPDCAGLDGQSVGIQSQAGGSTARLRGWIEATCPGTTPEYVVIEGSQNRFAALLADQIEASPLELADAVRLELEASDTFHRLANLAETQNLPTTIYGNNEMMQANRATVEAFIQAILTEHRRIADDPGALEDLIERYAPGQENIEPIAARYLETNIFGPNGELTEEVVEGVIEFLENADFVEPGLTVEQVADLSYLDAVLAEIGRE